MDAVEKHKEVIRALLQAEVDSDLASRTESLRKMRALFLDEFARLLERPLNQRFAALEVDTFEKKRKLVEEAVGYLAPLDLVCRCPRTGEPATLLAVKGWVPAIGEFQFRVPQAPKIWITSSRFQNLPPLRFAPLPRLDRKGSWAYPIAAIAKSSTRSR